jgi:hypothetical protein
MKKKTATVLAAAVAAAGIGGFALFGGTTVSADTLVVYKDPDCGCCGSWVEHMERSGFDVAVRERTDMDAVKAEHGVPDALASCHTALIGDYVVEGHVPAADIRRLLAEKPAGRGLAVPGMPAGSPGMEVGYSEPYTVYLFTESGGRRAFARH